MLDPSTLIALALIFPLCALITNYIFRNQANLRDGLTLLSAAATFITVVILAATSDMTTQQSHVLLTILPGLEVAFKLEPLGMVFALIASGLWIVTHLYGIGYMRGNNESHHARFFACFCVAISATLGIAFSGNMFTLFLFYEILTVSTYPLVAHKGTTDSKKGARTYLGILIGTSVGFQLLAIIWTYAITGTLDFTQGGILEGHIGAGMAAILLALYAFGIGKAALMPFHRWLPAAMVAPTPVSALLHAVAVVKAGVFTMLKVGIYIFGIDFLASTGASTWLMWLAAFSILAASIVAMGKDNLKARLAYSTISQLSYITLGMALATQMGALGGGLHIAMHAFGKITLFMCAGAIYVATHKTNISDMDGMGRKMPWVYFAFLIGALSIIGLPPLGGSWSKYLLMLGAADNGQLIMIGVLMLSSLLNVAYLLPIVGRGFFRPLKAGDDNGGPVKTPVLTVLPPLFTAFGCLLLFFYASEIVAYLEPIVATPAK
jgi:multicomponent Na+:H+ antiporter subunit D